MSAPTITVTAKRWNADGKPAKGTFIFEPSVRVLDTTSGAEREITSVEVRLRQDGSFAKALTATTGAGVNPAGWLWKVSERITGVLNREPYFISLPAGTTGGTVDLKDLSPVADVSEPVYGPAAIVDLTALEQLLILGNYGIDGGGPASALSSSLDGGTP